MIYQTGHLFQLPNRDSLEPFANLFVGKLGAKQIQELIAFLESESCSGVVIAHTKKNPMGIRIKKIGQKGERAMCDLDGVQLVKRLKKQQDT